MRRLALATLSALHSVETRPLASGAVTAQIAPRTVPVATDRFGRPLRSLRLSVTDRCNLRCSYCMPEDSYVWLPKKELLDFDELRRLVGLFCDVGVDRLRLTGGEPLLRRGLVDLVAMLRREPRLRDVALTTNGTLLADHAEALRRAGLDRVTVSLDTLRPERFRALSRRDDLSKVFEGIEAAAEAGFPGPLKIDTVVLGGVNDDELSDLIDFGRTVGAEVRFIEYMDVGGATRWSPERVVTRAEILDQIRHARGPFRPLADRGSAPAEQLVLEDGTVFGVIASTTAPFCGDCDRSRVTADGMWLTCLYATRGVDLKTPLRAGSDDEVRALLTRRWSERTDRGAERRLAEGEHRGALVPVDALRSNPHLEMHTRGG